MPAADRPVSARNLGLDLLRLAAVVLVIGCHLSDSAGSSVWLLGAWRSVGWVGVDLFFVLSGFLVSGLLFREHRQSGRVSVGNFLIRRGLKIYPAFWVLIAYSFATRLYHGIPIPKKAFVCELLFVQNYGWGLWAHTWSLAVEEHFYLLLAALVWWLARRRAEPFARLPLIFGVVAAACLGLRVLNTLRHPVYTFEGFLTPTHLRIDSLFLGVLLSYLVHYRGLLERLRWFRPRWRVAAGLPLLLVPVYFFSREADPWVNVLGYNVADLGSALLVLGGAELASSPSRLLRGLGTFGAVSYSVYLWHVPVELWSYRFWPAHRVDPMAYTGYMVTYVLGSLLVGYVMARLVEIPILKLRDRWFPSRRAGRVPTPVMAAPDSATAGMLPPGGA
ncbi:MAG: acyltransferase family protein [Opitutales bacterium]